jgi:hypothetical protein
VYYWQKNLLKKRNLGQVKRSRRTTSNNAVCNIVAIFHCNLSELGEKTARGPPKALSTMVQKCYNVENTDGIRKGK